MSRKRVELIDANHIEVKIKNHGKMVFNDDSVIGFVERKVTPFGNSAKIDFPREYASQGYRVYVVVCR